VLCEIFVGDKNASVIKMRGKEIKIKKDMLLGLCNSLQQNGNLLFPVF
jgi:DNA-binding Xre family transcriptional regulator